MCSIVYEYGGLLIEDAKGWWQLEGRRLLLQRSFEEAV
jgi:hypothetical protein